MGAILLDGVVINKHSLVAAGSILTPNTSYPSGSLIMGSPAKVKRQLSEDEITKIIASAHHYVDVVNKYKQQ